jgi:hypothetical protein
MNVTISIGLGPDDPAPAMTPQEMLIALGGDPAKDSCGVSISAGHMPPPPPVEPLLAPAVLNDPAAIAP